MAVGDAALLYGHETTYGTAATLGRAYEAVNDPWQPDRSFLQARGFRPGLQATRSNSSNIVNMGAHGSAEMALRMNGMGLLLQDVFNTKTGPTLVAGTTYTSVFQTGSEGPTGSGTFQMIRPFADTGTQQFTYKGSVCTGWELTQELDKVLMLKSDFDVQDTDTTTAAGTPTYVVGSMFDWSMLAITVGGTALAMVKKLSLKADYRMNTDRRYMRGNPLKKQPHSLGLPKYTGTLEGEWASLQEYTRFLAGAPLVAQLVWTGPLIEATRYYTLTIDLPAIQYTGEGPEVSLDAEPQQNLPFEVLWDGTLPAIKLTFQNTDAAL